MTPNQIDYPAWCKTPHHRRNVDLVWLIHSSSPDSRRAKDAKTAFLHHNQGLIRQAARRHGRFLDNELLNDLEQDARECMLELLPRYDPYRSAVSSYFVQWFATRLPRSDSSRCQFSVYVPSAHTYRSAAAQRQGKLIESQTGSYPSRLELARALYQQNFGGDVASICRMLELSPSVGLSVEHMSGQTDGDETNGSDRWETTFVAGYESCAYDPPDQSLELADDRRRYHFLLNQLRAVKIQPQTDRTFVMVIERFLRDPPRSLLIVSNASLAKELGFTREWIRLQLPALRKWLRFRSGIDLKELSNLALTLYQNSEIPRMEGREGAGESGAGSES